MRQIEERQRIGFVYVNAERKEKSPVLPFELELPKVVAVTNRMSGATFVVWHIHDGRAEGLRQKQDGAKSNVDPSVKFATQQKNCVGTTIIKLATIAAPCVTYAIEFWDSSRMTHRDLKLHSNI